MNEEEHKDLRYLCFKKMNIFENIFLEFHDLVELDKKCIFILDKIEKDNK